MRKPSWREELVVFFPTMDNQHREIARRTDELLFALSAGRPDPELEQILTGLIETTANHFATEEGLMLAHGYGAFEEHRNEHRSLMEQLLLVKRSLSAGHLIAREATANFIRTLAEQHIIFSDKRLAGFLIDSGLSS